MRFFYVFELFLARIVACEIFVASGMSCEIFLPVECLRTHVLSSVFNNCVYFKLMIFVVQD